MNEKEVWLPVIGYEEDYEVSSLGRIRSFERYKINSLGINRLIKSKYLTNNFSHNGYHYVMLWDGTRKQGRVNRIVAQAFLPNPNNLPEVNHKNGVKTDNRVSNLEWVSKSENGKHRYEVLGQVALNRKLSEEAIYDIWHNTGYKRKNNFREGEKDTSYMSNKYGITITAICNILKGKYYREITENYKQIPIIDKTLL